jgi:hypothetical protein
LKLITFRIPEFVELTDVLLLVLGRGTRVEGFTTGGEQRAAQKCENGSPTHGKPDRHATSLG